MSIKHNSMIGKKQSEESNKKRCKTMTGRKRKPFSEKTKFNMKQSAKNKKLKYFIQQIDNNNNEINVFRTIKEAANILRLNPKYLLTTKFEDFSFKKIYK